MLSTEVNGAALGNGVARLPETLDIELDPPIEWNNSTYHQIHLEEPTGHMVERAEAELAGNMNVHTMRKYQIALVSQASNTPRQVIERMRISQIVEASDFLQRFIASGRATGET